MKENNGFSKENSQLINETFSDYDLLNENHPILLESQINIDKPKLLCPRINPQESLSLQEKKLK